MGCLGSRPGISTVGLEPAHWQSTSATVRRWIVKPARAVASGTERFRPRDVCPSAAAGRNPFVLSLIPVFPLFSTRSVSCVSGPLSRIRTRAQPRRKAGNRLAPFSRSIFVCFRPAQPTDDHSSRAVNRLSVLWIRTLSFLFSLIINIDSASTGVASSAPSRTPPRRTRAFSFGNVASAPSLSLTHPFSNSPVELLSTFHLLRVKQNISLRELDPGGMKQTDGGALHEC